MKNIHKFNMKSNAFNHILNLVYQKSPLQKKKIKKYLATQNESFFLSAEQFAQDYIGYLNGQHMPLEYAVDAYLKMCGNMLKSQIYFMKTGRYPVGLATEAYESVYKDETAMKSYMIGLALSQALWPTHYEIFSFFADSIKGNISSNSSYLEIGPGHGFFLREAMKYLSNMSMIVVADISQTSIEITKSVIYHFFKDRACNVTYRNIDVLDFDSCEKYDFITMGEVLEHVNFPEKLLTKLRWLLNSDGKAFVSTCVNGPAIDHVYHFRFVDEIRNMLEGCGLIIKNERVLPVENLPMEEVVEKKITINYCAIIGRG